MRQQLSPRNPTMPFPVSDFSNSSIRLMVPAFAIGLLALLIIARAFEWTPGGVLFQTRDLLTKSLSTGNGAFDIDHARQFLIGDRVA